MLKVVSAFALLATSLAYVVDVITESASRRGVHASGKAVGSYDHLAGLSLRSESKELGSDYRVFDLTSQREVERNVPMRQLSVTALRWELEPIADGTDGSYTSDERKASFSILNALERLERDAPNHRLSVSKDLHYTLREPGELTAQIQAARGRAAERERVLTPHERAAEHERILHAAVASRM